MKEVIGVENWTAVLGIDRVFKKDALFFNKIAIPYLDVYLKVFPQLESKLPKRFPGFDDRFSVKDLINQTEWLIEKGFLFEVQQEFGNAKLNQDLQFQKLVSEAMPLLAEIQEFIKTESPRTMMKFILQFKKPDSQITFSSELAFFFEKIGDLIDNLSRSFALQLRYNNNLDAYPILLKDVSVAEEKESTKADVVQISLNALPIPDETTSWEQILDFRRDADSMQKFADLRIWINEITKTKLNPIEVEQKLEHLIHQYKKQIELHKMKTNTGFIETFITTSAEIAEDLAKFKFGKLAKTLFSFKQRKIALLEGEFNAKGKEVAYIIKTNERF